MAVAVDPVAVAAAILSAFEVTVGNRFGHDSLRGALWESVGRDIWGARNRLGLSRHRALPERIGASVLKPQIMQ